MKVHYFDNGKYALFDGLLFCRDDTTGYYLNSTTHTRLHRAVWEHYNGPIPDGYHIHHKDHDKQNNEPDNLQMVTREEHNQIHADEMTEDLRERLRQNLADTARPKASEWHGSAAGRSWHKEHYEQTKDKLHQKGVFGCAYCGKEYETQVTGANRYCSNACKSAARRKSGVDNEKRVCVACGKEYEANKYSKTKTCSRRCRNIVRWGKERQENRDCACL